MNDGPYLMSVIRSRCVEDGDCLVWQGGSTADRSRRPKVWMNGNSVLLRRALWIEKHGEPRTKVRIGVKCETAMCVNPEHLVARVKPTETRGIKRSPAFKAQVAATKRAASRITAEMVAEMRASTLSNVAIGKQMGLRHQTVARIRNRETWKDYSSPFSGLGARQGAGI